MAHDEILRFVLESVADNAIQGFDDVTKASAALGKEYADLTEQEKEVIKQADEHARALKEQAEETKRAAQAKQTLAQIEKDAAAKAAAAAKIELERVKQSAQGASNTTALAAAKQKLLLAEQDLAGATEREATAAASLTVATDKAAQAASQYAMVQEELADKLPPVNDGLVDQASAMAGAMAASAALISMYRKVTSSLDQMTEQYNKSRAALVGLKSVADGQGLFFGDIKDEAEALIADGLMPLEDAAASLKNLLQRGFSTDEAVEMITRFKDAAAFGRQAGLELGEAVKTASEGIRNENSVLVDNAGVTKNVSVMWKEYAAELGITTEQMTIQQKRQAEYNGIMEETRHQVGDATKLAQEYAGAQARQAAETKRLQVALGEAHATGVRPLLDIMTKLTAGTATFAEKNKTVIAGGISMARTFLGVAAAGTAVVAVQGLMNKGMAAGIPIVKTLAGSFTGLWAAMAPVAGVALAVGLVIGVFTAAAQAAEKTKQKLAELNDEVNALTADHDGAARLVEEFEELQKKSSLSGDELARMNAISRELVDKYEMKADLTDREGNGLATNLETMKQMLDVKREEALMANRTLQAGLEGQLRGVLNLQQQITAQKLSQLDLERQQKELREKATFGESINDHAQDAQFTVDIEDAKRMIEEQGEVLALMFTGNIDQLKELYALKIEEARLQMGENIGQLPIALTDALMAGFDSLEDLDTSAVQSVIERYMTIDSSTVLATAMPEIQALKEALVAELAMNDSLTTDQAANMVDFLLEDLTDDSALNEATTAARELRRRIDLGIATPADRAAYDQLGKDINGMIDSIANRIQNKQRNMKLDVDVKPALWSLDKLGKEFGKTAEELDMEAIAEKVKNMSMGEFISEVEGAAGALDSLTKEFHKLYDLQSAIDTVKAGAEASDEYSNALGFLADSYGMTEEGVLANLDAMQADADMTSTMLELKILLAQAEAMAAQATIQAMVEQGTVTQEQADNMIAALDGVIKKLTELNGTRMEIDEDGTVNVKGGNVPIGGASWSGGRSGGGGGGRSSGSGSRSSAASQKNEALERELKLIERKKRLDQMTTAEEIAQLEYIRRMYAKTADERAEIDDKLYDLRKQKRQADLEHAKAMDRLTLAEEIEQQRAITNSYKAGTDARLEAERQLHELLKQQEQQAYDLAIYYDKLTTDEQIRETQKRIANYKVGTEARIELEKQLYDLQKTQRQQQYDLDVYYDRLTIQDQIKRVEKEVQIYKEGTEARIELEKQLYDLRKQLAQDLLDRDVSMDRITVAEQIARLQQMATQYTAGTEARLDLEQQIYDLQKQQRQQAFEDDVYYGRLTLAEQATRLRQMADQYKQGTEVRKEIERQLFEVERQQRQQLLELDIFYGRITLEQQRERLKEQIDMLKAGTQERIDLERQLHDTLQQIRDRDVQNIDKLTEGIKQAIAARYRAQQAAENERINDSIKNWQTWAKEQQEAIQAQIKALDDSAKAEDRAEQERQKKRDIAAAKQALLYEQDAYNRRKLEEEIAKKEEALAKWQAKNERDDLKTALQEQAKLANEISQEEQRVLREQQQANNEYYAELMKDAALRAEAEKQMMASTQDEILQLMRDYLPDYDALGQSMGERLVDGFRSKVGDIDTWMQAMMGGLGSQQSAAAAAANAAASAYWSSRGGQAALPVIPGVTDMPTGSMPPMVINFNQPIESPAEVVRSIERLLQDISR